MLYSFEDFALDAGRRELRRGGNLVAVEPKVFDLLVHLVANRERVVSKDDLIAAVWDGRIVSDAALTTAINAVRTALGDSGEAQRLIKTLPRKGFRFVGDVRGAKPDAVPADAPLMAPAFPDKPSIAVLPFSNLSADAEQEYFADGIVEEMITELSRMRRLFVIARNSSFIYKGRSVDVKQVGQELGVRYVLQGSVRKAAQRLRITAQLVDATTGANLWADRFEGTLEDVFDLQDKVTASVMNAVSPQLEKAEIARIKRKPTESLDAYDTYLRGIAAFHQWTRESTDEALRHFYRAIELGPDLAAACAMAAMAYARRKGSGWVEDRDREVAEIKRLARQAARLGPDDAVALSLSGFSLANAAGELDDGAGLVERALQLNPNLAPALLCSGWVNVWLGEQDLAIEHLSLAMRLSPLDPFTHMMLIAAAHAHFFAGRFEESAHSAERALRVHPEARPGVRIAAASYALAGRDADARKMLARYLQLDPARRVSNMRETMGAYRHEKHMAQYENALRLAGLPD
jgi:TolB-like protein